MLHKHWWYTEWICMTGRLDQWRTGRSACCKSIPWGTDITDDIYETILIVIEMDCWMNCDHHRWESGEDEIMSKNSKRFLHHIEKGQAGRVEGQYLWMISGGFC